MRIDVLEHRARTLPEGARAYYPGGVRCPHEDECPGCTLIRASADEARAAKERRLTAAVSFYPELRDVPRPPLAAPSRDVGYRTRAKLAVGPGGEVGLFAEGTHRVVDLPA